jgi:hypothetical protein
MAFQHLRFENEIIMKLTNQQIEYVENYIISKDMVICGDSDHMIKVWNLQRQTLRFFHQVKHYG